MAETGEFHPKSLCIDLETSVEVEAVIYKIAAWRADTGQSEVFKGRFRATDVKPKLDGLTAGASFLLGHNVVQHDLPLLKRNYPDLTLLSLPVIDTLELSPVLIRLSHPLDRIPHLLTGFAQKLVRLRSPTDRSCDRTPLPA